MRIEETEKLLQTYLGVREEWESLKDNNPEESKELKKAIQEYLKEDQNFKELIFQKSEYNFSQLVQDNYLSENKTEYNLSGEKILPPLFEILEKKIRDTIQKASEQLSLKVRNILHKLYRIDIEEDYSSVLLIYLDNYTDINILKLAKETIGTSNNGVFAIYHELCEALPFFKINDFEPFCENITAIKDAVANDLTNGIIFTSLKKFSEHNPAIAQDIYSFVKEEKQGRWAYLLNSLLLGLGNLDFEQAFKKAFDLVDHEVKEFQEASIISLGFLDYKDQEREILNQVITQLETFQKEDDPVFNSRLARAYGNLPEFDNKVLDNLLELSKSNVPEVQIGVSEALFQCRKQISTKGKLKKIFSNLSTIRSDKKSIIRSIDLTLSELVSADVEFIIEFLNRWQLNRNNAELRQEASIVKLFKSTFSKLFRNEKEKFEAFLTNWFNSQNNSLHLECRQIVKEFRHKCSDAFTVFELSTDRLNKISLNDYIYITKKILGYIFDGKDQCSLVFSVLKAPKVKKEVEDFVYAAFRDRIAYNYPGLTREFLEEKRESGNKTEKRVAIKTIDHLDEISSKRKNLSYLNELQVPDQLRKKTLKARGKYYNKVYKESQKHSIVSQITTQVPLKYGNKWMTEWDEVIQPPSGLGKISTSVELPQGELIDPIGEQMIRVQFQEESKQ